LLNNPSADGMFGHIEVKDASTIVSNDKEGVKHAKGERRDGEEVHRCNCFTMIAQKHRPLFCRLKVPAPFLHPTQHRTLRKIEARHFQLTMNPRCTPSQVLGNHSEDQFAQFPVHAFSSCLGPMPREPRPVQLEPRSMPTNDSLWLDNDQRLLPSTPKPPQDCPEQSVRSLKSRLRTSFAQDRQPMPKRHVFQEQIPTRAKEFGSRNEQKPQQG
jgi:hypothetical protein